MGVWIAALVQYLREGVTASSLLVARELLRLRRAAMLTLLKPVLVFALAIVVGYFWPESGAKRAIVLVGIIWMLVVLGRVASRYPHVVFAPGLAAAISALGHNREPSRADIAAGIYTYLRILAGIAWSEIAIGFMIILLPVERQPIAALCALLVFIGVALGSFAFGSGTYYWPKIGRGFLVAVGIYYVAAIIYPPFAHWPARLLGLVVGSIPDPAGLPDPATVSGDYSFRAVFWGALLLFAGGFVVWVMRPRRRLGQGLMAIALVLLAVPALDWFLFGPGYAKTRKELFGFANDQYSASTPGPTRVRVEGSLAPRKIKATEVIAVVPGKRWEVVIDGSNEYGRRKEPYRHGTPIRLQHGQRLVAEHVGGIPAFNMYGRKASLCGMPELDMKPWERLLLAVDQAPPLALGVILARPGDTEPVAVVPFRCGERELKIEHELRMYSELEVSFFFNQIVEWRDPRQAWGKLYDGGLRVGGWTSENDPYGVARFTVAVEPL